MIKSLPVQRTIPPGWEVIEGDMRIRLPHDLSLTGERMRGRGWEIVKGASRMTHEYTIPKPANQLPGACDDTLYPTAEQDSWSEAIAPEQSVFFARVSATGKVACKVWAQMWVEESRWIDVGEPAILVNDDTTKSAIVEVACEAPTTRAFRIHSAGSGALSVSLGSVREMPGSSLRGRVDNLEKRMEAVEHKLDVILLAVTKQPQT